MSTTTPATSIATTPTGAKSRGHSAMRPTAAVGDPSTTFAPSATAHATTPEPSSEASHDGTRRPDAHSAMP